MINIFFLVIGFLGPGRDLGKSRKFKEKLSVAIEKRCHDLEPKNKKPITRLLTISGTRAFYKSFLFYHYYYKTL